MKSVLYMPDGNRRFARKTNTSLLDSYRLGAKTLKLFSDFFIDEQRTNLLVYHAMSKYTHLRTDDSLDAIYKVLIEEFERLDAEKFFSKKRISFETIDHSGKLPRELIEITSRLSENSRNSERGRVCVLLGYDYESDIDQALSKKPRNYKEFREGLLFPDIDLVIRTTEMRASGGPAYAMSQSQMMLLDKLNPEVTKADLEKIMRDYEKLKGYRIESNPIHHN